MQKQEQLPCRWKMSYLSLTWIFARTKKQPFTKVLNIENKIYKIEYENRILTFWKIANIIDVIYVQLIEKKEIFSRICCNSNFGINSCYSCLPVSYRKIHAMVLREANYTALKDRLVIIKELKYIQQKYICNRHIKEHKVPWRKTQFFWKAIWFMKFRLLAVALGFPLIYFLCFFFYFTFKHSLIQKLFYMPIHLY